VRRSPNGKGGFEIAYGHNRLAALKELNIAEIDVPVRDLDDTTTIAKIMSHENLEEWGHSSSIEQETARSIVEAFGEGKITLPSSINIPTCATLVTQISM
jgi:ParB-like chromosome segregation protein Spo0J